MPISSHKDNAIKEMYEKILKIIEMAQEKDNLIILVDWKLLYTKRQNFK